MIQNQWTLTISMSETTSWTANRILDFLQKVTLLPQKGKKSKNSPLSKKN